MSFVRAGSRRFALELRGKIVGFLDDVSGGPTHDAVLGPAIAGQPGQRQLGLVQPEDIRIVCGTGMSKAFYDWVAQGSNIARGVGRMDGAIVTIDAQGRVVSRLEWRDGLISEISFPVLDAAATAKAGLTIKITPEFTKNQAGDGSALAVTHMASRTWLASNFRLKIHGLEEACSRVSRIESLTITNSVKRHYVGTTRSYELEPVSSSPDDLEITLPESSAKGFRDWYETYMNDKRAAAVPKSGTLDLLTPNLSSTFFSLSFTQLQPYKMSVPSDRPGAEIRKVKVIMGCQGIQFAASPGAS